MFRKGVMLLLLFSLACSPTAPEDPFRATDLTVNDAFTTQLHRGLGTGDHIYELESIVRNNSGRTLVDVRVLVSWKDGSTLIGSGNAVVVPTTLSPGASATYNSSVFIETIGSRDWRDVDDVTLEPSCTLGAGTTRNVTVTWN